MHEVQEFENHIATVHDNVCALCGYKCDNKDMLTLHMKFHEINTKIFKCIECDYECISQDLLHTHSHTGSHKRDSAVVDNERGRSGVGSDTLGQT